MTTINNLKFLIDKHKSTDNCLIIDMDLSVDALLDALHSDQTATVILEPQEQCNGAIHGYCITTNRLIYDAVLLAYSFDYHWHKTPVMTDSRERIYEALEWVYYNRDVGPKFIELETSWEVWNQ